MCDMGNLTYSILTWCAFSTHGSGCLHPQPSAKLTNHDNPIHDSQKLARPCTNGWICPTAVHFDDNNSVHRGVFCPGIDYPPDEPQPKTLNRTMATTVSDLSVNVGKQAFGPTEENINIIFSTEHVTKLLGSLANNPAGELGPCALSGQQSQPDQTPVPFMDNNHNLTKHCHSVYARTWHCVIMGLNVFHAVFHDVAAAALRPCFFGAHGAAIPRAVCVCVCVCVRVCVAGHAVMA
jgi:hypothetical protein